MMIQERMKEIFQKTINTNLRYTGDLEDINYFNLYCKAASDDHVFKILGANFYMLNFTYEGDDSVLMVFSIPINSDSGTKHIAERVMEIIENTEQCFVTLDYSNSMENKDDKFVYVTIVKKYNEEFVQSLTREIAQIQKKKKRKMKKKEREVKSEKKASENDTGSCSKEGSESSSDNQKS